MSERTLPTYDEPSSDAEGGREGGAGREDYGETDTQASVGQSSVDDASESSSGSSLVPLPAPLRQPQSLTSVTVFQASPLHLTQANSSSSIVSGGGSRTTDTACLRPRFHSDSIDTNTFNTTKTHDDNDDSKDDTLIEIKRTPSFLQKITGKGKSPLRTPDKDKKGLFSIFKRKKHLGFADDVICKMSSSDGSPPGPSLLDSDIR